MNLGLADSTSVVQSNRRGNKMPIADPEARRKYQREWYAKRRADYLADKCCVRCGATVDLRLDHIDPKTKVSHSIWSWSQERRDAEIAKCQVLCEPCHKKKTVQGQEHAHGEMNGHSRFVSEQVLEMRRLFATGSYTLQEVASRFDTTRSTVHSIVSGRRWKHLQVSPMDLWVRDQS